MKQRIGCFVLAFALLLFGGGRVSAFAVGDTAQYVFSRDDEGYLMEQSEGELTFWEAPNVVTGQTRGGGVITLKNTSDRTVDFTLTNISLPYDNVDALTYLDAVTLVIEQDGEEIYHAPFTRLMDSDRAPIEFLAVAPGESRELHLSVSCAFTYEGAVPSYESLVWTFEPTMEPQVTVPPPPLPEPEATVDWTMIATIAAVMLGALVLTCILIAVVRLIGKRRRSKHEE